MIFFQGLKDKVVLPSQTEKMVNALRRKHIPVEVHTFPDEGHGFRKKENEIEGYGKILTFLQTYLKREG